MASVLIPCQLMSPIAGHVIASRRAQAGISRRELARRARTSAATLAKYERGEVSPGVDTLERILDAALPRRRRWPSLGALADAVADELRRGRPDLAWRICTEVFDDEHGATADETRLFASRYPPPTGESRADAVVAALAEWVCVRRGIPTPLWTIEPRVCRPFWFVNPLPGFQAAALRDSPPCFAARGIFVRRADLVTA